MEQEPSNKHQPHEAEGESSGERTSSRDNLSREARPRAVLSEQELEARAPLKVGDVVDRKYKVLGVLGCGGQSWVFHVSHAFLDDHCALKLIHRDDSVTQETFLRGLGEARIQRQIGHPNIARVEDAGVTPQGQFYLVMELMPGRSLRNVLADRGSLDVHEVLSIGLQIAEGMHAVHEQNIIHRDLKPENLFINPGNAIKIIDFGVAKILEKPPVVTERDLVLGTVQYMSPEQFQARPITARSDIYSLGVVLYELFLGERLVEHLLRRERLNRDLYGMGTVILKTHVPLLHEVPRLAHKVPPYVSAFVNQCLAKADQQRFQSMQQVADALRVCQGRIENELGRRKPARELWRRTTAASGVVKTDRNPHAARISDVAAPNDGRIATLDVSPDGPTAPAPPSVVIHAHTQRNSFSGETARLASPAGALASAARGERSAGMALANDASANAPAKQPELELEREPGEQEVLGATAARVEIYGPRQVSPGLVSSAHNQPAVVVQPAPAAALRDRRAPLTKTQKHQNAQSASVLRIFATGGAVGAIVFGVGAIFVLPPAGSKSPDMNADTSERVSGPRLHPALAASVLPQANPRARTATTAQEPGEAPQAVASSPTGDAASVTDNARPAPIVQPPAAAPRAVRPKPAASSSATVHDKDVERMRARVRRVEADMDRDRRARALPKSGLETPSLPD